MNIFRIVSFIKNVRVRFSGCMTLNKKFFCMRDIMNRLLRDLEPGGDLMIRINGNRGFQEAFPGFSDPLGIIRAGVRTGKSG